MRGEGATEVTFGNCELQIGELQTMKKEKPAASTAVSSKADSSKMVAAAQRVDADVVDVVSELMK